MLKRDLKILGSLSKEEKEKTWKTSISGSQAWLLINEPYNLIRDKLGIPREHKSKTDFINSQSFQEKYAKSAKQQGTDYEPTVYQELLQHFNFENGEKIYYEDWTFKLNYVDTETGNVLEHINITSTPDYYITDSNDAMLLVGDIKCSTAADNESIMFERYEAQALHNCYVLNNTKEFELDAKGVITKPLNRYQWTFTDEKFNEYENLILEFFENIKNNNITAYDYIANENEQQKLKEAGLDKSVEVEPNQDQANKVLRLIELKNLEKDIKAEKEELENFFKTDYENLNMRVGDNVLVIKSSSRKGAIDYTKAINELSLNKEDFEEFRKPSTTTKTLTIKNL